MWSDLRNLPKVFRAALDREEIPEWAKGMLEEQQLTRLRPPLLMRLEALDVESPQDTYAQFVTYGWRYGEVSSSLASVDKLIEMTMVPEQTNVINGTVVTVADAFRVRIHSAAEHNLEHVEYKGPRAAFLYFPADLLILGEGAPVSATFGGPSDTAMDAIRKVALALNLRIKLIEVDSLGGVLVMYNTYRPEHELHTLKQFWTP